MPRSNSAVDRRGVALAAAIFALAVMGGIVAGGFGVALLEQQSGRNLLYVSQAAEAAEGQLWAAVAQTPDTVVGSLVVGGPPLTLAPPAPGPGISGVIQIYRLADNLFLIRSRSSRVDADGNPLASRAAGLLAALEADSLASPHNLRPISRRPWLQLY